MNKETVKFLHAIVKSAVSSELKQYHTKLNSTLTELKKIQTQLSLLNESRTSGSPVHSQTKQTKKQSNVSKPSSIDSLINDLGITPFDDDNSYISEEIGYNLPMDDIKEQNANVQSILDVPIQKNNLSDPVAAVIQKINTTDYSKVLKIMENAANIERSRMSS